MGSTPQHPSARTCLTGAPETKLAVATCPLNPLAVEAAFQEDLAAVLTFGAGDAMKKQQLIIHREIDGEILYGT